MPRTRDDIKRCIAFIAGTPRGKPADRMQDIREGVMGIIRATQRNRVQVRRRRTGMELRRYDAAQFAIIYVYFRPNRVFRSGVVSIRAVRHRRVRNVFSGVKEPEPTYGSPA